MTDPDAARLLIGLKNLLRVVKRGGSEPIVRQAYTKLNGSDLTVLNLVNEQPGVSMGEVSRELASPLSTATTVVDRLVRKGFVARGRDGANRRVIRLEPTDEGAAFYAHKRAYEERICRMFLDTLDSEDQKTFIRLTAIVSEGSRQHLDSL